MGGLCTGYLCPDGCVYGIPLRAESVLKIEPLASGVYVIYNHLPQVDAIYSHLPQVDAIVSVSVALVRAGV